MRFMIIRKADAATEAGTLPSPEQFDAMTKYHEDAAAAGILRGGDGLKPSSAGARVEFRGGRPTVTDGPFTETKELVAGFSIIDVPSLADAIEWVRGWPKEDGDATLEIRPFYEADDFGDALTADVRERQTRMRAGLR